LSTIVSGLIARRILIVELLGIWFVCQQVKPQRMGKTSARAWPLTQLEEERRGIAPSETGTPKV
jgi:hypothetical protein